MKTKDQILRQIDELEKKKKLLSFTSPANIVTRGLNVVILADIQKEISVLKWVLKEEKVKTEVSLKNGNKLTINN